VGPARDSAGWPGPGGLTLAPCPAAPPAGRASDPDVRRTWFRGVRCRAFGPAPPESVSGAHPGREVTRVLGLGLSRHLASTTSPHLRSVARWGEVFSRPGPYGRANRASTADQGMHLTALATRLPCQDTPWSATPAARNPVGCNPSEEEVMPSAPARRAAPTPVLSAEQYSDLRSDLEAELRRLILDAERLSDGGLRDLAPRARRRAMQIVDVLRRMGTETFGVCASCQSPIAYERLFAIPETTVCAQCSWSYEVSLQG